MDSQAECVWGLMVISKIEDCSDRWSGEYDSLPLSARLKMLLSRKQTSDSVFSKETVDCGQCERTKSSMDGEENGCFSSEEENILPGHSRNESFIDAKMLDSPCSQASDCSLNYPSSPSSSGLCVVSHGDESYDGNRTTSSISSSAYCCNDRSLVFDTAVSELQHSVVTYIPSKANEYGDVALAISLKSSISSSSASKQGTKAKGEISFDFDDDLENIVLRERRKMLLSRLLIKSQKPCIQVGEDLSEGEARVLSQYGWVPNTGLATMLNYCGRVVHDTNKERDGNEWRQKIGKMLVDGYNGGSLVPRFLVKKPEENESKPSPEVKLEIDPNWALL